MSSLSILASNNETFKSRQEFSFIRNGKIAFIGSDKLAAIFLSENALEAGNDKIKELLIGMDFTYRKRYY